MWRDSLNKKNYEGHEIVGINDYERSSYSSSSEEEEEEQIINKEITYFG